MKICDLTTAYTETSGGIRRYIDQKREFLLKKTEHQHVLIIPGEEDSYESDGRATTIRIASPVIPGCAPYRFFWRPDKVRKALVKADPDVIELASFYLCPWAALHHRDEMAKKGRPCLLSGYFHTDIADAYVGTPLRKALAEGLGDWSDTLMQLGLKIADAAEEGAEDYFASIFARCDVIMAATPPQAARLREYGAKNVEIVPLGVDLGQFSPQRRCQSLRESWGVQADEPVFLFAGRLDSEKHVRFLADAHARMPENFRSHLVLIGEGPQRKDLEQRASKQPHLHVLPYESDSLKFATTLASADVYVTAGPHETFGLSVIEAQACALPVVGVAAGALKERVIDGLGYLAPVDDADEFARLMACAWQKRTEFGRNAREHVEKYFSWDATFTRLLEIYSPLV